MYSHSLCRKGLRGAPWPVRQCLPPCSRHASRELGRAGGHSVGEAYWYKLDGGKTVPADTLVVIKTEIANLIRQNLTISTSSVAWLDAKEYFEGNGLPLSAALISTRVPLLPPQRASWICRYSYLYVNTLQSFFLLTANALRKMCLFIQD